MSAIRLNVATKIGAGFSIALLAAVALGWMNIQSLNTVYSNMNEYMEWSTVDMSMNEDIIQNILLLGRANAVKRLRDSSENIEKEMAALDTLKEGVLRWEDMVANNPDMVQEAAEVQKLIDEFRAEGVLYKSAAAKTNAIRGQWDELIEDMLGFLEKTMDEDIDPMKDRARRAGDTTKIDQWAAVDETMNEAVIAKVLALKTASHDYANINSDEGWDLYSSALADAQAGLVEWRQTLRGMAGMEGAADRIGKYLDEYAQLGLQYRELTAQKQALGAKEDKAIKELREEMFSFMESFVDPAKAAAVEQVEAVKASSLQQTKYLLIGMLCVVGLIGIIITRNITVPLRRANAFVQAIADGNFDVKLDSSQGDEIGQLCRTMAHIPDVLKDIMSRIAGTTNQIVEGDLRASVPMDGLKGEFRNLAEYTNLCSGSYLQYMDAIPMPLMAINNDHLILYLNKAGHDLGGFETREEFHKKIHCWDVFKTSDCQTENCACAKTMISDQMEISETDAHPSGMDLEIKYIGTPIHNAAGEVCGAFEVVIDQTEVVEMQRKISGLAEQASEISDELARSSQSLSAQIEQANRGAVIQSERTAETATAMEEMNATVLEVAQNASRAAENTNQTMEKARAGNESVENVVIAIRKVHDQTQALKTDMVSLGKQAQGIGTVIEVISDIADQTNLLALNAAIEAARAGEAGRGFAVVADEVRKLAEKTMGATTEVNNAIGAVQNACKKNVTSTDAAADAVNEITALVDNARDILVEIVAFADDSFGQVQSIATASEEQSAAAEEISRATEDVSRISGETGEAMNDASRSVSDVDQRIKALDALIQQMVS